MGAAARCPFRMRVTSSCPLRWRPEKEEVPHRSEGILGGWRLPLPGAPGARDLPYPQPLWGTSPVPSRAQHTPGGEPAAAEAEERGPALAEVLRVRLGAGKRFRAKKMLLLRVSPASSHSGSLDVSVLEATCLQMSGNSVTRVSGGVHFSGGFSPHQLLF